MSRTTDAQELEARGLRLWAERRLVEAAEMFEVAADLREELAGSAENVDDLRWHASRTISDRGAAKRLRVTAWASARWPGRVSDRCIMPLNRRRSRSTRHFFAALLATPGAMSIDWPRHVVAIDRRNRIRLLSPAEVSRLRLRG